MSVPIFLPWKASILALGVLAAIVWTVEPPIVLMHIVDVTIKVLPSTEGCSALRLSTFMWSFMLLRDMATMAIVLACNIQKD